MRLFLTGVGCVGKTTIGKRVADLMSLAFFDLDHEVETFFGTSIERLQKRFLTMHSFRTESAKALLHLLDRPESRQAVIALPPSGLMGGYLRAIKKSTGMVVALWDKPENILDRITFYDIDSHLLDRHLTPCEKRLYLREIKKDMTYFGKSYVRADLRVDIEGQDVDGAARKIQEALELHARKTATGSAGAEVLAPRCSRPLTAGA